MFIPYKFTNLPKFKIANGVTLIFQGGRFTSSQPVTISGPEYDVNKWADPQHCVAIEAPLSVIFGKEITVTGMWHCPYTSPLWFEPAERANHVAGANVLDHADAINKAIAMCLKGTVFLPKGDYYISKPIFIPQGITLKGEAGQLYKHASTHIFPLGTAEPTKDVENPVEGDSTDFTKVFPYDYMFYVNCDINKKPSEPFANPWIAISHITLMNYPPVNRKCRCVYACSGAGFESVVWYDFIQAISFSPDYADGKCVVNCSSGSDSKFNEKIIAKLPGQPEDFYMFDLKGLGDSLLFMHNHLGSPLGKILNVLLCGGGSFQGNILNGDVRIHYSKGISFTDNHMESGAQIVVDQSIINFGSNYIEKGTRPSVVVKGAVLDNGYEKSRSVVSFRNDQFTVFSQTRNEEELKDINLKKERFRNLSEYDIEINSLVYLDINNTFRYDLVGGFGDVVPFGIQIKTDTGELTEFNRASYYCSRNSKVLPGYVVQAENSVNSPNTPNFDDFKHVGLVNWMAPLGTYRYMYRIIWDVERKIMRRVNSTALFFINVPGSTLSFQDDSQGVLFNINGFEDGNCLFVQMYRQYLYDQDGKIMDTWEKVEFPLCGANMIYDNGISIAGFKWQPSTQPTNAENSHTTYDYVTMRSGRVNAWTSQKISKGSPWRTGDIVYNSGTDTSWTEIVM